MFFAILKKNFDIFDNKNRESTQCNYEESIKRYYENRDKIVNQQKTYFKKMETNYYRNETLDI